MHDTGTSSIVYYEAAGRDTGITSIVTLYNTRNTSIVMLQYRKPVSCIVCFTILVLPVLLDEEYWSFQYRVFYNTSITSIVG
jgi:hypothetical protein